MLEVIFSQSVGREIFRDFLTLLPINSHKPRGCRVEKKKKWCEMMLKIQAKHDRITLTILNTKSCHVMQDRMREKFDWGMQ